MISTGIGRIVKLLVSAGLITALLLGLDWEEFIRELRNIDIGLASIAVVLLSVQYPISAWKWQKSLAAHDLHFGFGFLLKILCFGAFFNNFLPTAIGGDAYRAYRTVAPGEKMMRAISAVVLERLMGILALALIGALFAGILIARGQLADPAIITAGLIAAGIGVVLLGIAYWSRSLHFIWDKITRAPKLMSLAENARVLAANRGAVLELFGLSLMFQAIAVSIIAILFDAVDVPGALLESGFVAAIAGVAAILPISVNGIGVVEGSFVIAALESNLPYAPAVLVALFLRLYLIASSVVFGLMYALESGLRIEIPSILSATDRDG